MFIGETATRLSTTICPMRNGVNMGGGGLSVAMSNPCARTVPANQACTSSTNFGSREHAETGLDRTHAPVAGRIFGPKRAHIRGILSLLHIFAARALKRFKR